MLTFQPLKTKALKPQGNITRKRKIFKCRRIPVKRCLTVDIYIPTLKNSFDEMETENKISWEISAVKKYCTVLDYRQQSCNTF